MKKLLIGLLLLGTIGAHAASIDCSITDDGDFSSLSLDLEGGAATPSLKIKNGTISLAYKGKSENNLTPFPTLTVRVKKQSSSILIPMKRDNSATNGNAIIIDSAGRKITVICMQKGE